MAVETFKTNLTLGQDGNTAAADVDDFRNTLKSISDAGNVIDVQAMVQDANAITEVKNGTINFALCSATSPLSGSVADHLNFTHEFGMEVAEYLSWWYEGGGQALYQAMLDPEGVVQFPIVLRAAESGGWFREAMTLKKMLEGYYASGLQMRFRAFGTHQAAMNAVFPNIVTPAVTAGLTELSDIFGGNFNGGEFNEPIGDASLIGGLFPNYPAVTGSIIAALGGRPHYYVGSYHTPFRARVLLVNKTFYDALSADDKVRIEAAARFCTVRNVANSMQGGDAIIKVWQGLGAVIHRAMPLDILDRFRQGMEEAQDAIAATDANYATILTHQRAFMKANAVRWGSLPSRKYRVARTAYETDLKVDAP